MCGRFPQKWKPAEYVSVFKMRIPLIDWPPRYNLSPGQNALVVLKSDPNEKPEIKTFHWCLIPYGAKGRGKYS
jgi:putative SOS response-associated peptidase YedK